MKIDESKPSRAGEIIEGKVVGRGRSSLFLDLGAQGAGIIYGKEYSDARTKLKSLKTGDKIMAKITDLENEDGYIELSVNRATKELAWQELEEKKESGQEIKVNILGANKGGLLTKISDIQAFLPSSHLKASHYPKIEQANPDKILKELQKMIGQELKIRIIDISKKENKLILSEKAESREKIKEMLKNYKVGDIVEGEITGLTDFGAFMKFNSELEGLIHISEMDWKIITEPSEIVKLGDKVKAKIIEINENKIFLSLKALKKDPWQDIDKQYKKGQTIKGKVIKFNPFGAFIKVTPKIQGLCHISEFGTKKKMEEVLILNQEYDFQISAIDPKEHRMSLKPKQ